MVMSCYNMHSGLEDLSHEQCPFCNEIFDKARIISSLKDKCCKRKALVCNNGIYICKSCGQLDSYEMT